MIPIEIFGKYFGITTFMLCILYELNRTGNTITLQPYPGVVRDCSSLL